MNTSSPGGSPAAPPSSSQNGSAGPARRTLWTRWKQARVVDQATVIGTVAGVLSLLVAIVALRGPFGGSDPKPVASGTTNVTATIPATPTRTTSPITPTAAGAADEFLDGPGFPAESGGSNLVSVPRAINTDGDYTNHPVTISCPTNETGDDHRDVTYLLRGNYLRFDAEVRPYYPPGSNTKSPTYVTAYIGVTQQNGDLCTEVAGSQQKATMTGPQPLTASVEKAEKLTLRIQCSDPNGVIVLVGARLTTS